MAPEATAQTALDEQVIDNQDLEKALEDREQAKGAASEARKKYKTMNEIVQGQVEKFELAEGEVARCGRFRIEKKKVAPKDVSFSTDPSSRLWIKLDNTE